MKAFLERHPDLGTWAFLSLAFLAALAWSARDVDLAARQWATLSLASVITAGLCAWILSWEQDDEEDEDTAAASPQPAKGSHDEDR